MNRGFIGWIVLILVALALLYYFFDWSIFDAVQSDAGQATIDYIVDILKVVWGWIMIPVDFALDKIR